MTAIEILQQIKDDLNQEANLSFDRVDPFYIHEKAGQLAPFHPFDTLVEKWISLGLMGGGLNQDGTMQTAWAIRKLLEGASPEEVVELATNSIAANSERYFEISDVMGITVPNIVEIGDDVWLYPNHLLPHSSYNDYVFSHRWAIGQLVRTDTAALVRAYKVEPVYFDRNDRVAIETRQTENSKTASEHLEFKQLLRRALILQGTGPVEIVSTYSTNAADSIINLGSGLSSSFSTAYIFINNTPDINLTLELIGALRKFNKPLAMELAIDRLGRSRGEMDAVNKAIDLGMSLEVALMHDDQNAKEEINAKLGLRAGWLLGDSPESRGLFKKQANALYSSRSAAVHKGKIDSKTFDPAKADMLVRDILLAILRRGAFPDWNNLTFGGTGVANA